jgi:hypothetical protein
VRGSVFAVCDFTFVNEGEDALVTIGFPAEPSMGDDFDESGLPLVNEEVDLIKNFKVFLDGKTVEHELKKSVNKLDIPDFNFKQAYVWPVKFRRGQTRKIRHTYDFGVSGDSVGHQWVPYILRTGSLWKGTIGQAEIRVDLGAEVPPDYLNKTQPDGSTYEKGVFRWSFRDFEPQIDVQVNIGRFGGEFIRLVREAEDLERKTYDDLSVLRNSVFALRGKIFRSKVLTDYFLKNSMFYHPRKDYSDDLLTPSEWELVNKILEVEKKKAPKTGPKN